MIHLDSTQIHAVAARRAACGCFVAALLWFPQPAQAVSLSLPSQPTAPRDATQSAVTRAVAQSVNAPTVDSTTAKTLQTNTEKSSAANGAGIVRSAKDAKSEYPPAATKQEIEMGRKAVEALEKDPRLKLLDGSKSAVAKALLAKLNGMAREIGLVSTRPLIAYDVKVIDDDELNAFTLPNGHIYISRGLLDTAGSDDEIAAVIGHEIGHTARMHVTRGDAKTKPLQWVSLAALIAMLKGGQNGANIARITPYLLTGIVNSYSIEFEKEADQAAIDELKQTKYNPSALVSFMQRLSEEEKRRPKVELGIFQTHPSSPERVASALKAITDAGLTYAPRAVSGSRQASVAQTRDRASIVFGKLTLMELALSPAEVAALAKSTPLQTASNPNPNQPKATAITNTANANATNANATNANATSASGAASSGTQKRAEAIAVRINQMLRDNLKLHEITIRGDGQEARLFARDVEIARATLADARLQNTTPLALAQTWKANFGRLFWSETLNGAL